MTAFARREATGDWGALIWELRAVNHRYLEVQLRLPEELRGLETALRERIQGRLSRGKVDCALRHQAGAGAAGAVDVDDAVARSVIEAIEHIEKAMNNPARLSAMEILRWPGVVREQRPDLEPLGEAATELLSAALDDLVQTRAREGERLAQTIEQRCAAVLDCVAQVRERRPQLMSGLRDKLRARIDALGVDAEPGRIEQELAIVAQRLDVDEELDRLQTHVAEVREAMQRDEPVGRRLDFLMQELNREANTLGSKSNDAETTQIAVELKVLIEQMREQVQNIE
jgi:uncharacterized protein (TIGR00255 family)